MTKGNHFKLKEGTFRLDIWEDIFYDQLGETLAQAALETLTGWVSDQHDLFEDDSTYGKMTFKVLCQHKISCGCMINL